MFIIYGFVRVGDMRRVFEVFDMMRRNGCILIVYIYNVLVFGFVDKR